MWASPFHASSWTLPDELDLIFDVASQDSGSSNTVVSQLSIPTNTLGHFPELSTPYCTHS
jgi:hypothetical protein